ncbi:UDP binding domain-containing protein, partial [Escherichia coli]|uniref:UDP binding domain-containing protein n=1 Tax=Escherichia coli TaxID=562 RepID=UPI0028DD5C9F
GFLAEGARVVGHDPKAQGNFAREIGAHAHLSYANDAYAALAGADALVLVSEWPEYKRPSWTKARSLMRTPCVFDFRNQWDG